MILLSRAGAIMWCEHTWYSERAWKTLLHHVYTISTMKFCDSRADFSLTALSHWVCASATWSVALLCYCLRRCQLVPLVAAIVKCLWSTGHDPVAARSPKSQIYHSRPCFTPAHVLSAPWLICTSGQRNRVPPDLLCQNPQLHYG